MTAPRRQDELLDLFDALCAGTLDDAQAASVEKTLADDPAARQLYVSYMHLRVNSQYLADVERPAFETVDLINALVEEEIGVGGNHDTSDGACPGIDPPCPLPIFSSSINHPLSTIHSAIFSYSVAALILSVGLAIAWAWKVPNYPALTHPGLAALPSPHSSRTTAVGRVTGMIDCRFVLGSELPSPARGGHHEVVGAGGEGDPRLGSPIHLDDRLALASGLMEIAYDTGAKVILQGPVKYEVESPVGGFLSVGKLTARVETNPKSEIRNPRSETISKSPNLQISKFIVRTPTATVTDLGTEFGVTVSKGGTTQVHVIQGVVDAQPIGTRGSVAGHRRVSAGAAIEIGRHDNSITTVAFAPASFTRKLQPVTETPAEAAYIKAVLADKPMGYWPLNEPAGARKILDRSGNGVNGYVMRKLALGRPGPLGGDSHAIEFNGTGYIDLGRCDQFAMKNDFTVEAWVWIGDVQWSSHVVSVLGGEAQEHIGWGLIAGRAKPGPKSAENPTVLDFIVYGHERDNFYFSLPAGEPIERRWLHVAMAFDRGSAAHLYLDGQHRSSVAVGQPAKTGMVWLQIGCAQVIDEDLYRGRLSHVAVYPRALDAAQIKEHCAAARSAVSVTGKETP